MIHFLTILSKKKFVRDVATVATGTVTVQVIVVAASPFITRLYGPEAYGVLGIFVAMLIIFNPIATLTYCSAIVLPEKSNDAKGLVIISMVSAIILSLLIFIVLLLFKKEIVLLFNLKSVENYLFLLPVAVLLAAIVHVLHHWLIRAEQFRKIAKYSIFKAILENGSKVAIGFFHSSAAVLIFLGSFGYFIYAIMLYIASRGENSLRVPEALLRRNIKIQNLGELAYNYRNFPIFRAPQKVLNNLSKNLPIILLAYFFSPVAAGYFAIAQRVLMLPAGIIGNSISNVYYPKIAKAVNMENNLRSYINRATLGMAIISVGPILLIVIFGPAIFEFVFGSEWRVAGHYARWLSFFIFSDLLLYPGKDTLLVMGLQKHLLGFEIASLSLKTLMLILGVYIYENDVIAVILFSIGGIFISLIVIIFVVCKSNTIHSKYA